MKLALTRSLLRFSAALLTTALALAAPAMAKQCIWNKGGFTVRIDWFKVGDIVYSPAADGFMEFSFRDQPVQTDVFASGSGRCINRGDVQYQALISIYGGSYKSRVVEYPEDWPVERRIDANINAIASPSTKRYLDIWGAVWDVQSGEGGPL